VVKQQRGNVAVPAQSVSEADIDPVDADQAAEADRDASRVATAQELARAITERTGWKVTVHNMVMVANKAGFAPIGFYCSTAEEASAMLEAYLTGENFTPLVRTELPAGDIVDPEAGGDTTVASDGAE
jgi:hypothetical protein